MTGVGAFVITGVDQRSITQLVLLVAESTESLLSSYF